MAKTSSPILEGLWGSVLKTKRDLSALECISLWKTLPETEAGQEKMPI